MNKYAYEISLKTRFLNIFRLIFTIPLMEKVLLAKILKSPNYFLFKLVPPEYLYPKNSYRFINRNNIRYKLDVSNLVDHYLYWNINDDSYNRIEEEIKRAKVIMDIGANIGTTALFYANLNKTAIIYAFEPHPELYKRAKENVSLNAFNNINLINIGVGEKKEILKLYEVNKNNPGMNRIMAKEMNLNLPYKEVSIEKLDDFVLENNIFQVDFIKIDIEGFEYSALLGAKNILIKNKPLMYIEIDDDNLKANNKSAKELLDLLISFGYKEFYDSHTMNPISIGTNFQNCHFNLVAR